MCDFIWGYFYPNFYFILLTIKIIRVTSASWQYKNSLPSPQPPTTPLPYNISFGSCPQIRMPMWTPESLMEKFQHTIWGGVESKNIHIENVTRPVSLCLHHFCHKAEWFSARRVYLQFLLLGKVRMWSAWFPSCVGCCLEDPLLLFHPEYWGILYGWEFRKDWEHSSWLEFIKRKLKPTLWFILLTFGWLLHILLWMVIASLCRYIVGKSRNFLLTFQDGGEVSQITAFQVPPWKTFERLLAPILAFEVKRSI